MTTRKGGVYRSIVKRCLECSGDRPSKCSMPECPIYGIRPGVKRSQSVAFSAGGKKLLPKFRLSNLLKAIRCECKICTSDHPEHCTSPACDFYQWRRGTSVLNTPAQHNPSINTQGGVNLDDRLMVGGKPTQWARTG